jgi:hypothetical protein
MEAHAELAESQRAKLGFAALDKTKTLGGHLRAVRQTRRKASGGWAVPSGQAGTSREKANLGFAEARIEKRSKNLMLGGGAVAGATIECHRH